MTTRSDIERTLTEMNQAENSPDLTAEQESQVVDKLNPIVQGWANGVSRGGRATRPVTTAEAAHASGDR